MSQKEEENVVCLLKQTNPKPNKHQKLKQTQKKPQTNKTQNKTSNQPKKIVLKHPNKMTKTMTKPNIKQLGRLGNRD